MRQSLAANQVQTLPASAAANVVVLPNDDAVITGQAFGTQIRRPNLVSSAVMATGAVVAPGQTLMVSWMVANSGDFAATGSWSDGIYLSSTPTLTPASILLTSVAHAGGLATTSNYNGNASVTIPVVLPGNYYVIVEADRRRQVNIEALHADNVAPSSAVAVNWDLPTLTRGVASTGMFTATGQVRYFQIPALDAETLQFVLDGAGSNAQLELYLGVERLPTVDQFDARAVMQAGPDRELVYSFPQDGMFYVMVRAAALPAGTNGNFSLQANLVEFGIADVDVSTADRGGSVTMRIQGSEFPPAGLTATLDDGAGHTTGASRLTFISANEIYATFNLQTLPVGSYDLKLHKEYQTVTFPDDPQVAIVMSTVIRDTSLPDALQVTDALADDVRIVVNAPASYRRSANAMEFTISYTNQGTHDVPSPILNVVVPPQSLLIAPGPRGPISMLGSLSMLGLNANGGPVDIIRPGQMTTVTLRVIPNGVNVLTISVSSSGDDGTAVTYGAFVDSINDMFTPTERADAMALMQARYGGSWTTFYAGIRAQAVEKAARGRFATTMLELLTDTVLGTEAIETAPDTVATASDATTTSTEYAAQDGTVSYDINPVQLAAEEAALRAAAAAFLLSGAQTGSAHLVHFLGGPGGPEMFPIIDIPAYGRNSLEAFQARAEVLGRVTFNSQEESAVRQAQKEIESRILGGTFSTDEFEAQVKKLDINPRAIAGSSFSILTGAGYNLQTAFGGMKSAQATVKDIEYQVHNGGDGAGSYVTYEGRIEFVFGDTYEFEGAVDQEGGLPLFGSHQQQSGWGASYHTGIELETKFKGRIDLRKDPEKDPEPPDPPKEDEVEVETVRVMSSDPNEIIGPAGFGVARALSPDPLPLPYTITYENDPLKATAPAQEVIVTHQLDVDLDWSTFALTSFGFGPLVIDIPGGLQSYHTQVDYQNGDGSPLVVDFSAALNRETGVVTWTMRSLDPATGTLPEGVFDGVLLVEDGTGVGQGFVNDTILAKSSLVTGTTFNQLASIVFDENDAIITNLFVNYVDGAAPSSQVTALAAVTRSTSFMVQWSGADNANGSGIGTYDVYVSDNGGAFTPFILGTSLNSKTFNGQFGHTYAFYSVATDKIGNRQATPGSAQTTTMLLPNGFNVQGAALTVQGTAGVDDTFQGRATKSVLTGAGYSTEISAFDIVYALAFGGGNDSSELFDSSGNDILIADGNTATMYYPAAFIQLYNFDTVTAHSTAGSDVVQKKTIDYSLLLDGPWILV